MSWPKLFGSRKNANWTSLRAKLTTMAAAYFDWDALDRAESGVHLYFDWEALDDKLAQLRDECYETPSKERALDWPLSLSEKKTKYGGDIGSSVSKFEVDKRQSATLVSLLNKLDSLLRRKLEFEQSPSVSSSSSVVSSVSSTSMTRPGSALSDRTEASSPLPCGHTERAGRIAACGSGIGIVCSKVVPRKLAWHHFCERRDRDEDAHFEHCRRYYRGTRSHRFSFDGDAGAWLPARGGCGADSDDDSSSSFSSSAASSSSSSSDSASVVSSSPASAW